MPTTHPTVTGPPVGRVFTLGLTGGIASGKSAVAALLVEHGAVHIDYDQLARQVVAPGSAGLQALAEEFGPSVLTPQGALDRGRLAGLVFTDRVARGRLDEITHPLVNAAAAELQDAAPDAAVVVHDIPLLVETGRAHDFNHLVVVDVPVEVQMTRLMARNAMSAEQARSRIAAQASRDERLAVADTVIDNAGSPQSTRAQVDRLWDEVVVPGVARCR
ncbi:dephospho-CoA kinase [Propionibacterium ruminifibrarum]|uniref:Dephospho-CoA kinase n=1 Tax=Propionibacterium ruminifibrarum TaxID=1962131 RepID=A0A375I1K4_9ACTN|nr:dephospho-CoA kinase [Propionibacterium ruminifibrarum]SPF68692.1 dephospho-CoA kinase [Propionibacterium ruminifibrarum]